MPALWGLQMVEAGDCSRASRMKRGSAAEDSIGEDGLEVCFDCLFLMVAVAVGIGIATEIGHLDRPDAVVGRRSGSSLEHRQCAPRAHSLRSIQDERLGCSYRALFPILCLCLLCRRNAWYLSVRYRRALRLFFPLHHPETLSTAQAISQV